MNETEQYIRDAIKVWVWSGFHDQDEVDEMLEDLLEGDVDPDAMREAIANAFKEKAAAEKSWPAETDCDRLDRVFDALNTNGIVALQNSGYTMSDGRSDVGEALNERGFDKYHGYCFYHGQDLERAVNGGGLMLAFGDIEADPAKKKEVGNEICVALAKAGFKTEWNGDPETRINIPVIDWKRRTSR
jgi:hypothetical protein